MKIALIEDDCIAAQSIQIITASLGFPIHTLISTFEEWRNFQQIRSLDYDIYFIDLYAFTPNRGIEIANWIKQHSTAKIIFITANVDTQTLRKIKEITPLSLLYKPLFADDFVKIFHKAC